MRHGFCLFAAVKAGKPRVLAERIADNYPKWRRYHGNPLTETALRRAWRSPTITTPIIMAEEGSGTAPTATGLWAPIP